MQQKFEPIQHTVKPVRQSLASVLLKATSQVVQVFTLRLVKTEHLVTQLKDYEKCIRLLFWQRQGLYVSSGLLAAVYYDVVIGAVFFAFMQLSESLDISVSNRLRRSGLRNRSVALHIHQQYLYIACFSSVVVSIFAITIASYEEAATHFTPLFYLFAAGLFVAMNNNQLPIILASRIGIYCIAFITIPVIDLLSVRPGLSSQLWLQLATVFVVLFFMFECSRSFLLFYRRSLDQLDKLREERDKAKAAYEVKSQFVSTVSHELRTPLTSILGSLSLLQSGAFDDMKAEREQTIDIAHKNSRRLADLINDLLDLQKIEAGQVKYSLAALNLDETLTETLALMQGYANDKNIAFKLNVEPNLPVVLGDKRRIEQLLKNLLSNAVKFSHNNSQVTVRASEEENAVLIEVTDTGIGIPQGSEEVVFGTFTQVDSTDHRPHQGSGLGLAISKQIAESHEGSLTYSSKLGEGTTFELRLPIQADISNKTVHMPAFG